MNTEDKKVTINDINHFSNILSPISIPLKITTADDTNINK